MDNVLTAKIKVSTADADEINEIRGKLEKIAQEHNITNTTFEFIEDE